MKKGRDSNPPLLQRRVNHGQKLGGFESLLLHGAAGADGGTCPAPLAQGIGHLALLFSPSATISIAL